MKKLIKSKLMKKLSKSADSSPNYRLLRPESRATAARWSTTFRNGGVPEGHLPVYVGEDNERFIVSAEFLNHPVFVKLLDKSAQEYGYNQKGVLRIPCHVYLFERVLETLRSGEDARELEELVDCFSYGADQTSSCY